jgi:hypothetical protein
MSCVSCRPHFVGLGLLLGSTVPGTEGRVDHGGVVIAAQSVVGLLLVKNLCNLCDRLMSHAMS